MTAPLPAVPERSIIFSAPMVCAILSGDKTQTRRALKVQPPEGTTITAGPYHPTIVRRGEDEPGPETFGAWTADGEWALKCPYGRPGSKLWVRETHAIVPRTAYARSDGVQQVIRQDDPFDHDAAVFREGWTRSAPGRWRPSIHMPRWASRITLEITGMRVERLRSISDEDCIAEGAPGGHGSIPDYTYSATPREHYQHIWTQINGADSWAASPWVWIIEFERVTAAMGVATPEGGHE